MNQQCKVCGEPAAGFHFGAFTCEGCKSFFGRSYNNLSSISECKNNGECIINKKNRTACKACRLRKCLLVGMSKSGSRYGRRSNWFKIHCLLQEQQQHAASAAQNGCPKPPALSPNSLNLMRHPSYSTSIFSRPPCSKEEMMMLRLDEYAKQQQHPAAAASPSISSPDSHNSDSSIEIGDKRNSLLNGINSSNNNNKQSNNNKQHVPNTQSAQLHQQQPSPLALNKDLFLPLPFAGFPFPMPPPGFLAPPTHFLFSSYHNALYEQNHHLLQQQVQQGLLKTASTTTTASHNDLSSVGLTSTKSPSLERSSEENSNGSEKLLHKKRHYTETLLDLHRRQQQQQNVELTKIPKRSSSPLELMMSGNNNNRHHHHHSEDEEEDIDMGNDESDEVLTPPRSPKTPNQMHTVENNPIDLSMKSGSSTKSDDINHNYYKTKTNNNNINNSKSSSDNFTMSMNGGSNNNNNNSDSDSNDHHQANGKSNSNNNNNSSSRKTIHCHVLKDGKQQKHESMNGGCDESEEDESDKNFKHHHRLHQLHRYDEEDDDDKSNEYEVELKRRKLHLAAPLDLTTKV
ncbi:hypothetical protein PVAND_001193 [Polypedilum vanderplanki]|uniref:Nuclear receptor domain-containing protein n=1 Tax=Polypedilum vanderplanki TaxID=319348 RepID=A0A9J6BM69_POLVA|nr:hypothetical protein PVAND_001193 [Polypedilum vanderplanki]